MKYGIFVNYAEKELRSIDYPGDYSKEHAESILAAKPLGYRYMRVLDEREQDLQPKAVTPSSKISGQTHYAALRPEPIDVIEGWGLGYNRGNVIKYVARAGKKDSTVGGTIRDLEKAITYLNREINALKGKPGW